MNPTPGLNCRELNESQRETHTHPCDKKITRQLTTMYGKKTYFSHVILRQTTPHTTGSTAPYVVSESWAYRWGTGATVLPPPPLFGHFVKDI